MCTATEGSVADKIMHAKPRAGILVNNMAIYSE